MFASLDPFFLRAIMAGVLIAVASAPLGCIIVWRRMAYVGETLAQSSLLGVALGLALQINLTFAVIVAAVVAAGVIILFGQSRVLALDSALGLVHHAALALGVIYISLLKGPGIDLNGFLFGDVFAISNGDVVWVVLGTLAVLGAMARLWKPLVRLSLHSDLATAEGVDPVLPKACFDVLLAVTIAVAMKVVGVLLVMAFLVVPAVAARPLSRTPESMVVIAALIGVAGTLAGLAISMTLDVPGGPAIVVAMVLLAAVSLLAGRSLRR